MEWSGVEWSGVESCSRGVHRQHPVSVVEGGVVLTYRHHLHMHLSSYPDAHGSELRRAIPLCGKSRLRRQFAVSTYLHAGLPATGAERGGGETDTSQPANQPPSRPTTERAGMYHAHGREFRWG